MKKLDVVCAIISREESILAAKRHPGGPAGDRWEFPGGKIEANETPEQAIEREIKEELGVAVNAIKRLTANHHAYPEFTISLLPIICEITQGEPVAIEHAEIRWVASEQLLDLDWSEADKPIVWRYLADENGTG